MSEIAALIVLIACVVFVALTVKVGRRVTIGETATIKVVGYVFMVMAALFAGATAIALAFYFVTRILGFDR